MKSMKERALWTGQRLLTEKAEIRKARGARE